MSTEAWIGILLSIPIGIGTSLVTPWVQRTIENFSKQRALIQANNTKAEFERINFYKQNPHELTQYLIQVAIKTTLVSAIIAVFAGFLFIAGNILSYLGISLRNTLNSIGLFISLVGSLMIINICRPALSTWTKVHNFDEYKNAVSSKLNE